MEFVLSPHQSVSRPSYDLKGHFELQGPRLKWSMEVQHQGSWRTSDKFDPRDYRKNWELWNWDVVETFLQLRSHPDDIHAPYLELQVSPLGQALALMILKPRVAFYTPFNLEMKWSSATKGNHWRSELEILLPHTGELWGGVFSCLGEAPREFFSLNPNPETKPDFHRPELFVRL